MHLSGPPKFVVRPFSKPARTDLKDLFRVYLSSTALVLNNLCAGDICLLQTSAGVDELVTVWPASEKIQDTVVQTSKTLQNLYSLKLGDNVTIARSHAAVEIARLVVLSEVPQLNLKSPLPSLGKTDRLHWAWVLQYTLEIAEYVCPGIVLDSVEVKGQRRSFRVDYINCSSQRALYRIHPQTKVQITDTDNATHSCLKPILKLDPEDVGGLDRQLKELNARLSAYDDLHSPIKFPSYYRPRRGGVILHGPSGTGKSMMLARLALASWQRVLRVNTTTFKERKFDGKSMLHDLFVEAHLHQPSLVIIDGIESIACRNYSHSLEASVNIASSLCEEFDGLGDARVFVVAATVSLPNVDESLRRPGRFEFEIEIPVPDSTARAEILKIVSGLPKNTKVEALETIAERTHGFVGADLDRLAQVAVEKGVARLKEGQNRENPSTNDTNVAKPVVELEVMLTDLEKALLDVRPTAMREVFLDVPKVRWNDIGGQHEIKKALEQAVGWLFKYSTEMDRLGIEPKKGLLLYGPPGCSKTLTAKAVATETGLNFIAVKGAELLNMYVGESERAIREVFRKARAASPSIIFFDEIDAIGSSSGSSILNGGLSVLTTLLNELDGIEILKGVFVLAATNKPEMLDPALMRPGRLDTALYVGLPDFDVRQEILQIRIRRMDVDDEVDAGSLAFLTAGYSGAELVSFCQIAGYAALEEQVQSGQQQRIGKRHFDRALEEVSPKITPEMIRKYKEWGKQQV